MISGELYPGESHIARRDFTEEELKELAKNANENVEIYILNAEIKARNEQIRKTNRKIEEHNADVRRGKIKGNIKKLKEEFDPITTKHIPGEWLISKSAYVIAKREAMGVPLTAKNLEGGDKKDAAINGFKYLVERIMKLDVEEYDALYSSAFNSKHLATAIRTITDKVNRADAMECGFVKKNILFKTVWPDYYRAHYSRPSSIDIFHPKGELKAALIHQCQMTNKNGGPIDQMAAHAIRDLLPAIGYNDRPSQLKFMANLKKHNFHNVGIFKIINDNCKQYACMLDFYYLNLPRDEQIKYIDVYYKERQKIKNVKPNKILDIMYSFFKIAEKKRAIARGEQVNENDIISAYKEAYEKLAKITDNMKESEETLQY